MRFWNSRLPLVLLALVAGLLLGSEDESADEDRELEWAMFGQQVSVSGANPEGSPSQPNGRSLVAEGTSFLYNKRTGKVYRIFLGCGTLGENGCMEEIPVVGNSAPPSGAAPVPNVLSNPNQTRR